MFKNSEKVRKVALYIRVSTTEQQVDGYGLEAQEGKLLDYVNNNKALNLITKKEWIFRDTHTGSDLSRVGLEKLMQCVREKKFDAVLVWKIDRLSRSLKHLLTIFEEFEKCQVSFISVQENIDFRGPIGRLIFQIFGAIAQFERELIKGRTMMGRMASAELGNYTGGYIPYGYKPVPNPNGKGKHLELVPDEKAWIQKIYDWYIYENKGFGQIAADLNTQKVPRGKYAQTQQVRIAHWSERTVTQILTNPIYRGQFVANNKDDAGNTLPEEQWTIVNIPPAISEFAFQQAQVVREERLGRNTKSEYLLSGKLRDMTIDPPRSFVGAKRTKGGYSYRRKQFRRGEQGFPVFEIPAKHIEEYVWNKIMEAMQQPEVFIKRYLATQQDQGIRRDKLVSDSSYLREQKCALEISIARIEQAYDNGSYSEEKMREKVSEKNEQLAKLDEEISFIEDQLKLLASADIEIQKLKDAASQVGYRLENLTAEQKKVLCNLFIDRIEMYRHRQDNKWHTHAEIFFRFKPKKFADAIIKDSTQGTHAKEPNLGEKAKKGPVGGRGGDRTHTPEGTRF